MGKRKRPDWPTPDMAGHVVEVATPVYQALASGFEEVVHVVMTLEGLSVAPTEEAVRERTHGLMLETARGALATHNRRLAIGLSAGTGTFLASLAIEVGAEIRRQGEEINRLADSYKTNAG